MKNYIELLSDDELRYVCGKIGARVLRDLYQKNGTAFSKLKRGFRPGSLTDEETYSFAIANRAAPFVADFLNVVMNTRFKEIDEAKEKAIEDGLPENIAVVETLSNSYFDERPALYFKLLEMDPPINDDELLCYAVKATAERNRLSYMTNGTVDADEQIEQLKRAFESEAQEKQSEYEKALEAAKKETETAQASIEQYRIKLDGAESSKSALEEELKTYRELAAHVEKEEEMKPTEGFHYASLCVAYRDDFGRDRLLRIADINRGEFTDTLIESAPEYTRLYSHDGPSDDGVIGVWDWRVVPNRSDPTRDFIESSYNGNILPVEVVTLKECNSVDDILKVLREGFSVELHTERILFSVLDGGKYEGVYCDSKVLDNKSGIAILKEDVLKLPVYTFYRIDTLLLDEATVLVRTNLGLPQRLVRVKEPMNIVRKCIISKVTWAVSQQKGFVRSEYQQVRAFLRELQTSDLYEEISKKCDCTLDEAIEYVTTFMNRADKIVVGNTVENEVMVQIIKNDPEIYDRCMSALKKIWEQENTSIIAEAQTSIEEIKKEEVDFRKHIETKEQELSEIQTKISDGNQELERQKDLAEEVNRLVLQKIENAKNNAAEFIANSAFVHATSMASVVKTVSQNDGSDACRTLFTAHEEINGEEPDVNDTYDQLLQTIQCELCEAGVADEYTVSLAALLYGAYVRHIPILLAGPNGHEIADAFTAAIDAKTAAFFTCTGDKNDSFDQCETSDDDIVVIENPLQAQWENDVLRLISKREKFYILTQLFADDLVVEPRGLFNYCLPVLTELFVSGIPTRNYTGGKMSGAFKHYVPETISGKYGKILDELSITSLAKGNAQALITDIGKLSERDEADDILQLLLYPLAYAVGKQRTLMEKIDAMDSKPSSLVVTRLRRLVGEEE